MSNRDSMGFGDLIPQDVVDIFAEEKHGKRGRKQRSRSLGRALVWLKGKKRKDLESKGLGLGLGPALDLSLDGHPAGHQGGHKGGTKSGKHTHSQGKSWRESRGCSVTIPFSIISMFEIDFGQKCTIKETFFFHT